MTAPHSIISMLQQADGTIALTIASAVGLVVAVRQMVAKDRRAEKRERDACRDALNTVRDGCPSKLGHHRADVGSPA